MCKDCNWSLPEIGSEWNLRCQHPIVNGNDPWALAASVSLRFSGAGTNCREERSVKWFAKCGMKGKLWKQKEPEESEVPA